ncbi:type VII secretion protein EccCa [Actinoplanes sp. NPDC051859]|uniref:type VII secretion protein EccCa n=1 Tax=Actinoplanes sp. NPDC051859 TaxID=3363909 RepID=UPI003790C1A6
MSTVMFRRVPRRRGPEAPQGELVLQEPPALPEASSGNLASALTYIPMAIASSAMVLMFVGPSTGGMMYLTAGLMMVSMLMMLVGQVMQHATERKFRTRGERRDYLRYLSQLRRSTRRAVEQQHRALAWSNPAPDGLWPLAMTDRLWERRANHEDFAEVRVALGEQRMSLRIAPVQSRPVEDLDPLTAHALRRFIRAYTTVADLPVTLYLRGFRAITMQGDVAVARDMTRALVAQLATFHAPDELTLVICADDAGRADWEWAKWLPHALHATDRDSAGPARLFCTGLDELDRLLGEDFTGRNRFQAGTVPSREEPFVVVVLDGGRLPQGNRFTGAGYRTAVLIDVTGGLPWVSGPDLLRLQVAADDLTMVRERGTGVESRTRLGRPDRLAVPQARALSKIIAPFRTSGNSEAPESTATTFDLASLLRLGDAATFDVTAEWASRGPAERLRVPIGITPDGTPVELDIKESAQGGSGPHGMLIGATGSGKSELLRTLVLALAVTHSSETLNFVLTDFKGGATFLGFEDLPHTSAVITNLADELPLVARMYDALRGELIRRQELLRSAGNYASVRDYTQARANGVQLDPLPSLFVVVDEFSELLAAYPDFMELFVMIGRLGRSLGVHLLLASQRLDDGRMHQLETHLSYRIGLRTFSAMESRSVLGVPDAYELPSAPGNGYVRLDVSSMVRFKAAYVSGAYRPPAGARTETSTERATGVVEYVAAPTVTADDADLHAALAELGGQPPVDEAAAAAADPQDADEGPASRSVMRVLIDRLRGQSAPAHQVWLPPLAESPTLDQLMPPLLPDRRYGLRPTYAERRNSLVVPLGVVDRPLEQRRELLTADLTAMGGHVGIAGAPQSGKSTLLRTLITSLALHNSPREVQFYCLDFGGGALTRLAGLPHVGAVAARTEADRIGRIVTDVLEMLAERERTFAAHAIDGMSTYRTLRRQGKFDGDPYGDVFLVVDGWATLRQEFDRQEEQIRQIAARGLSYGVHLVAAAARWNDIHLSVRDQLGTKLELRLGEAIDSSIDIRAAATVPTAAGRGLTPEKLHFLAALPRIDGLADTEDLTDAVAELVQAVGDAWTGPAAPRLQVLPDELAAAQLPAPEGDLRMALGVTEGSLAPFWHDFADQAHLTVLGDSESGKSNVLRLAAEAIIRRYGPAEAQIALVDLRRTLVDWIPEAYRLGYAVTAPAARDLIANLAPAMRDRLPGPDVTPEQLRRRDWWSGIKLFILLDDYDLVASSMSSVLEPLLEMLPYGADIGLHVVLARGAAGAGRAAMDPALRKLDELNVPDLMLSCPPLQTPSSSSIKGRILPPGRAQLATRRGVQLLQTGYLAELSASRTSSEAPPADGPG